MDSLAQFETVVSTFQRVAGNTAPDQLDIQTPCEQWKVRDLFRHVTVGTTTFAAVVRGEEPPAEVAVGADPIMAATASASVADIDSAFRSPGALERVVASPFGEMTGDTFLRLLAFDILMHSWDLATATGQQLDVPDALVSEIDGFARAALSPSVRGPDTFGPEVQPTEGASPLERLVAFSGRNP